MKTKIGFLIISDGWSGAESVIYNLSSYLSMNNKLKVYILANHEIIQYYSDLKNVTILDLGERYSGGFIKRVHNFVKIRERIRHINLDLINLNLQESFIALYKNKISNKISQVVSLHGIEIRNLLIKIPFNIHILLENLCLKESMAHSRRIISVGKSQITDLPEEFKKKTLVIGNGVDTNLFIPISRKKRRENIILFAGKFVDMKGIREIVNVAKQLPQYEFWFAGQGQLANLINLPNTKNLGFKKTKELANIYNQATICVFPSYRESFGLVGLEAMACGRAVIATPLGFSEYIEDSKDGIIIPAKDEKALKESIIDLMTNPQKRKKLEKNARKKAMKYSWEKVAKQYLEVYKKAIYQRVA